MFTIIAPNENYSGNSYGVPFVKGRGMTDNAWLAQMFREHGYQVEEEVLAEDAAVVPDLNEMTVDSLKSYADEKGIARGKAAKKDEIIAAIEASKASSEQ